MVAKHFNENSKDGDFDLYKGGDKIIPWKVINTYKGADLEGIEYEQLMPYVTPPLGEGGLPFRVIIGDFVTTEDGTGVVHTAPTFGADDFRVAAQNNVPSIMVKDADGKDVPLVNKQEKVRLTGKKMDDKVYIRHTGYPGGQRFRTPREVLAKNPRGVVEAAVK
ncbi:hypothetical protein B566_EDAN019418, partial [Ephemera danica]